MNAIVLIFITVLAIWTLFDLFFPERTKMGKQLVEKIIEIKLLKASYREFLYDIIKKNKGTRKQVDKWLASEYTSWLDKKLKKDELSDIIKIKD